MEILEKDLKVVLYGSDSIRDTFIECAKVGFIFPFIPFIDMSAQELFDISAFSVFGFPFAHYVSGFEIEISGTQKIEYGGNVYKTNTGFNITPLFFGSRTYQAIMPEKRALLPGLEQAKFRWVSLKLLPRAWIYLSEPKFSANFKYIIKKEEKIYAFSEEETELSSECVELPKDINKLEKFFLRKGSVTISVKTELDKTLSEKYRNLLIISERKYFLCLSLNE